MEEIEAGEDSYGDEEVDSDQDLDSELNDNFDINDVNKRDSDDSHKQNKGGDNDKLCSDSDDDDLDQDLESNAGVEEAEGSRKG